VSAADLTTAYVPQTATGFTVSDKVSEDDQAAMAAKAMAVTTDGATAADHPVPPDHESAGFVSIPRADYPPSGAFDAEGHRPVLERSRKER
jgi:hypothetical protein